MAIVLIVIVLLSGVLIRPMNPARLMGLGVAIIFVGFWWSPLGRCSGSGGSSSSGGFILIGPIPIVFGSGPNSGMLATVALVITVGDGRRIPRCRSSFGGRAGGERLRSEAESE